MNGKRLVLLVLTIISAVALSSPVSADTDGEREALALMVNEIDNLSTVLSQAQAQSKNTHQAVKFKFNKLRKDLNSVRQGIVEYLNYDSTAPRVMPPMIKDDKYDSVIGGYAIPTSNN